jgi:hypothetical protein
MGMERDLGLEVVWKTLAHMGQACLDATGALSRGLSKCDYSLSHCREDWFDSI